MLQNNPFRRDSQIKQFYTPACPLKVICPFISFYYFTKIYANIKVNALLFFIFYFFVVAWNTKGMKYEEFL